MASHPQANRISYPNRSSRQLYGHITMVSSYLHTGWWRAPSQHFSLTPSAPSGSEQLHSYASLLAECALWCLNFWNFRNPSLKAWHHPQPRAWVVILGHQLSGVKRLDSEIITIVAVQQLYLVYRSPFCKFENPSLNYQSPQLHSIQVFHLLRPVALGDRRVSYISIQEHQFVGKFHGNSPTPMLLITSSLSYYAIRMLGD